jgi:hypothetical protein
MMKRLTTAGLLAAHLFALAPADGATNGIEALDFKEVFEVLRTNLAGMDEQEIKRAAARGLIAQLRGRVTLLAEPTTNSIATNIAGPRSMVFDKAYGYVRLGEITAGAENKFAEALANVTKTNRLKGLVLDLRFSGGEDYAAAAAVADRFFSGEQPLIDFGDGLRKSRPKDDAVNVPVTILVNAKTAGAAEALAGVLRLKEIALLLGANTAGQANIAKTVTLSTGQSLRIATVPVRTGDGNPLPATGLKPDITVDVKPDEEFGYVEDVYRETPRFLMTAPAVTNETAAGGTNRSRRRINEADLVRMLRDGQNLDAEGAAGPRRTTPAPPTVQDPALARALDLLKGLAVVQQTRTVGAESKN